MIGSSIHTPRGRRKQQEPFARPLGNLNARTRERLPTSSVTATSCNPSPTFPHLHSQHSGPWPGPFICVCLSVYVCITMWVGCLFERLRWCAGCPPPQHSGPWPRPFICVCLSVSVCITMCWMRVRCGSSPPPNAMANLCHTPSCVSQVSLLPPTYGLGSFSAPKVANGLLSLA